MPEFSKWIRDGAAADAGNPPPDVAAGYIADMTAQLARLARRAELGVLAYLLDMAAAEARGAVEAIGAEPHPASHSAR
ncbi:MAG TPA: hypothetical protein VHD15_05355 [Hyphomicrobiales bacterium]|nr:hypothetical protein [Hyphomicrobiales bacterium]